MTKETKIGNTSVEIATKNESIWMKYKETSKQKIEAFEEALIIEKAFLGLCEEKIQIELSKQD